MRILVLLLPTPALAATYTGGDWGGADLTLQSGDALSGTFTNVGTFQVGPGASVSLLGDTYIEAEAALVYGEIDGTGAGYLGGTPAPPGLSPRPGEDGDGPGGGTTPDSHLCESIGGGGAGFGGSGGDGGYQGSGSGGQQSRGGDPYGVALDPFHEPGSGGGAGGTMFAASGTCYPVPYSEEGGRGGAGGGGFHLSVTGYLELGGVIRVDGETGFDGLPHPQASTGGGGGGSGGGVSLIGGVVNLYGQVAARGGRGGASTDGQGRGGGGGAGGRISVIYGIDVGGTLVTSVAGGSAGQGNVASGSPGLAGTLVLQEDTSLCDDADNDGYASCIDDCNDLNTGINPGAAEVCNGVDDNCNGLPDDGLPFVTYYTDGDGDGSAGTPVSACAIPPGGSSTASDCDDGDPSVHPGATEVCNGADEDCDGQLDEGLPQLTWYVDGDGDGSAGTATQGCLVPPGAPTSPSDCDDSDGGVHPGASETCDGVDQDCDGTIDDNPVDGIASYADNDGDAYGTGPALQVCTLGSRVATPGDCDDTDPGRNPGVSETCDGVDEDCDGTVDDDAVDATAWTPDADGDSYGDEGATAVLACTAPPGFVVDATDCDDTLAYVHPGATEQCNGADDDCDGLVDESTATQSYWRDADGDGYGDPGQEVVDCAAPSGYVLDATDCDDTDSARNPGVEETCNGVDDDCDGTADDAPVDGATYYADVDADGHGDPASAVSSCVPVPGRVTTADDCDDTEPLAWDGAAESCDGVDNDCDGATDPPGSVGAGTWYRDADNDTFGDALDAVSSCNPIAGRVQDDQDCDDLNAAVNPTRTEVCDGLDNDCDGTLDIGAVDAVPFFEDADGDTFGAPGTTVLACQLQQGLSLDDLDCDDTVATTNPDALDQCGDGVDNDCDTLIDEDTTYIDWYPDTDGDNYGDVNGTPINACDQPAGHAQRVGDCDDADASRHPNANELCDLVDNDCDGLVDDNPLDGQTFFEDFDGDGFGEPTLASISCDQGTLADNAGDCDDYDAGTNPFAVEVCDLRDNDCNLLVDDNAVDGALWFADDDGDGYGDAATPYITCVTPVGVSQNPDDCDDTDDTVNPGAPEICDGLDNDCDGGADDADTYLDPGAGLDWWVDQDGDGFGAVGTAPFVACAPPVDAALEGGDCNDFAADTYPSAPEVPGDGIDQDCDGDDADPTLDSDGDGIPDYLEEQWGGDPNGADSDGDGVPDSVEGVVDTDLDGLPDFVDTDDDDDGVPSIDEGSGDFDGDGIPDHRDLDSDGDDVPDRVEAGQDHDGDGLDDRVDASGDGAGVAPTPVFGCATASPSRAGLLVTLLFRRR
ncbi:MAG: putative metal-binding motif-containing protein [Alphaproteobacteria bacterium]|nr:putative metal-binding motif-containing protein [Alphaproteobacteria bacterium]